MNIVFRCADPILAPGPREESVHFCGILYLFEIPSVWSRNTDTGKWAYKPFSIPSIFMMRSCINGTRRMFLRNKAVKAAFTQFVFCFRKSTQFVAIFRLRYTICLHFIGVVYLSCMGLVSWPAGWFQMTVSQHTVWG